jgi:hypothetical protein
MQGRHSRRHDQRRARALEKLAAGDLALTGLWLVLHDVLKVRLKPDATGKTK